VTQQLLKLLEAWRQLSAAAAAVAIGAGSKRVKAGLTGEDSRPCTKQAAAGAEMGMASLGAAVYEAVFVQGASQHQSCCADRTVQCPVLCYQQLRNVFNMHEMKPEVPKTPP
jgi:hypothetical protein